MSASDFVMWFAAGFLIAAGLDILEVFDGPDRFLLGMGILGLFIILSEGDDERR